MKKVVFSTKSRKDLKRYKHNTELLRELWNVIDKLCKEEELPPTFRKHLLTGQYKNCFECHVRSDKLLIWIDGNTINILRFGTHSELFD